MRDLATYNSERFRGIVHTRQYVERMADLQARFDARDDDNWCSSHRQSRGLCRTGPVVGACIINGDRP